ncbi:MAG: D-alanyl-D-alanine carboxypeptidase family protein [Pseudomonadota bacterium]
MRTFLFAVLTLALAACTAAGPSLPEAPDADITPAVITQPLTGSPGAARARAPASIVVDARTGRVLYEQSSNSLRYPASLTKMMTIFVAFEEIKAGRLSLDTPLTVSSYAAGRPPSKIGVRAGSTVLLRDAIQAMAVRSANDMAAIVAENISGSEAAFADYMTRTAKTLGMNRTRFVNASGLPDRRQVTTARDMAILSRALKTRHRRLSRYFAQRSFTYRGRTYRATNRLLGRVDGVDGIKTGYIRAAGYNLAASATRNGRSIIVVVIGGRSGSARNAEVTRLIERYTPGRLRLSSPENP